MSDRSIIFSPAPYHILSYGTLLGTTFFHTFVNSLVLFRTLPRPQFSASQTKLFPIYFGIQTGLPAILALTYPGGNGVVSGPSGLSGVLDTGNRSSVLIPLAAVFISGFVNMVVLYPAVQKVMAERRAQEKKDGKKSYDPAPHSQEMLTLNKQFGMIHGISSLLNLVNFIASVVYGFTLSARLQ